jgi:hypothetical protein
MALADANGLPVHKFWFAITTFSLWDYADVMASETGLVHLAKLLTQR